MAQRSEAEELAASLRTRLSSLSREGLSFPQVTALLTEHVVGWASDQGWQPACEVRSRIARQTKNGPRQGRLDVVCERPGGLAPVAIEIDRFGKVWSLQKLIAEADAGAVALWVRWRGRTQVAIPAEIGLVDISAAADHAAERSDGPAEGECPRR